jgi:hypothetical protein
MGFSRNRTTASSSACSSCALIGMVWPNFACTQISLWRSWMMSPLARRRRFAIFKTRFALPIIQRSSLAKLMPVVVATEQCRCHWKFYTEDEPLKKNFNLQTYKYHSLGDYVKTIRQFGTTDSYSTTTVSIVRFHIFVGSQSSQGELEHRRPKAWHLRTDRKAFVKQMTQIERRQARIRRIKHKLSSTRLRPRM